MACCVANCPKVEKIQFTVIYDLKKGSDPHIWEPENIFAWKHD